MDDVYFQECFQNFAYQFLIVWLYLLKLEILFCYYDSRDIFIYCYRVLFVNPWE
jgi:hypothetical protein